MPDYWRKLAREARRTGHGGGDYFIVRDFVRAVRGEIECPIGIHEAMDMTLPGLVSQQSILRGGAWMDVPDSRRWTDEPSRRQLHMVWPREKLDSPPTPKVPRGYVLRQWRPEEMDAYIELMDKAGFGGWTPERVEGVLRTLLPDGFFVIEHKASGRLVATAQSGHKHSALHPYGGELGWVAGDPEHKGKGLGMAVCAAATARLIAGGYKEVYLSTDDWRLPAIKVYLKLGYEPMLYRGGHGAALAGRLREAGVADEMTGYEQFGDWWGERARLAWDTLAMRPTAGIGSWMLHVMDMPLMEELTGNEPGSFAREPERVYLAFQKLAGACFIDQYIPRNPLTMEAARLTAPAPRATRPRAPSRSSSTAWRSTRRRTSSSTWSASSSRGRRGRSRRSTRTTRSGRAG